MIGGKFLQRAFGRNTAETADLRDRLIMAETRAIFLENALEGARRPKREKRKDSAAFKEAFEATTAKLREENAAAEERRFRELAPTLFRGLAG